MKSRRTDKGKPTVISSKWFREGTTVNPENPVVIRKARADRRTARHSEYLTRRPLAALDELRECLQEQSGGMIRLPRWVADAATMAFIDLVNMDRRPGRNASYGGKARMDAIHRVRHDMVREAHGLGLEGKFALDAAVVLCDETPPPTPRAVQQSYARVKNDKPLGMISAQYVLAPTRSTAESREAVETLLSKINEILHRQAARQRSRQ